MPLNFFRLDLPPPPAWLAALALAFVLPGLAGHDPWKSQDAIGIGIAYAMAQSGDGIVPRVAGYLWLNDAPLYHWIAWAFGRLLRGMLEFHAGARLASAAFVLGAFWLIYAAARDWADEEHSTINAAAAMLILLGSVGLVVHAHEALPELAALASLCGALAALPFSQKKPFASGTLFGVALGFAALSSSWIPPAALGLTVAGAHLACGEWRTRKGFLFVAAAIVATVAIGGSWPAALAWRSRELFDAWWALNANPQGAAGANLRYFLSTGAWFAWPAWPLALWTLWVKRGRLGEPRLFVPLVATAAMLFAVGFWGPAVDVNLIPMLAPLALLAAQGVPTLRRGATAALDWFAVLMFAFVGSLVWLVYAGMMTGVPPRVAANVVRAAPGFVAPFEPHALLIAVGFTLIWFCVAVFAAPSPSRSITRWAAGIILVWGLFAMLLMPWADYQKSYRSVALQLRAAMPPKTGCITQRNLGLPQAAAFHYHAGILTQAFDQRKPEACTFMLVQGSAGNELDAPGPRWAKIADVGRPGDRTERHRLYRLRR
jgi:4-amino-4-deoxy-L-arabinose transferase-like glycosyltransferase